MLTKATTKQAHKPVVRGLSWNDAGTVLCLQSDNEIRFINAETVLNFDWAMLPVNKKIICERDDRSRFANNITISSLGKDIKKSDIFVPKRKRANVISKIDLEAEAWKQLIHVEARENSFVLNAKFSSKSQVASLELTHDSILSRLPPPLAVGKFGAK